MTIACGADYRRQDVKCIIIALRNDTVAAKLHGKSGLLAVILNNVRPAYRLGSGAHRDTGRTE